MSDQILNQLAQQNPLSFLRTPEETRMEKQRITGEKSLQANINFGNAIAAASMPVARMTSPTGQIDKETISNLKPYEDIDTFYNNLRAEMPADVEIDQQAVLDRYAQGKQQFDMQKMNELNLMRQRGMSEKDINKAFKDNPEFRDYLQRNGMLEIAPKGGGYGGIAAGIGAYGAVKGVAAGSRMLGAPIMTDAIRDELRKAGYKFTEGKGIETLSGKDLNKSLKVKPIYNDDNIPESFKRKKPVEPTKPKSAKGKATYEKNLASYRKRMKDWRLARNKAIREAAASGTDDAVKAAQSLTGEYKPSTIGRQALKRGTQGVAGRAATNFALGRIGSTLGANVGKGLLMGGAKFLGMTTPVGIAANAALLAAPWIWSKLSQDDEE